MQTLGELQPYVCFHYPGRIVNVNRMLETLGGQDTISEVICDDRRKPQLWFRPEDKLSKTVNGTRKHVNSLVMKVRVKKRSKAIVSHQVIGFITEEFTFHTLCDFQYLAVHNGVNVYDKVVPSGISTAWIEDDGVSVLVPPIMSRIDTVQSYHYVRDKQKESDDCSGVISSTRRKRYGLARFLNFEDQEVPTTHKDVPAHLVRPSKIDDVEILRKVFEERPIFSKTALAAVTGLSLSSLKDLVPYVAYHFSNGPWRAMWVKFGYDPRTDPSAKIYQTLDFRVRSTNTEGNIQMRRAARSTAIPRLARKKDSREDRLPPDGHIFAPGKLPPFRIVYYQYCDIQVPEVQGLLETAELRSTCDILDGWLPEGTSFACRRIMNQYVTDSTKQLTSDQSSPAFSQQLDSDSESISENESDE